MIATFNIYIRRAGQRGPAESNQKFDNALLRAVHHSPGSRELCRECGPADAALRITLYHVQSQDCRCFPVWSIVCTFRVRTGNFVAAREHCRPSRRFWFTRVSKRHFQLRNNGHFLRGYKREFTAPPGQEDVTWVSHETGNLCLIDPREGIHAWTFLGTW